MARVPPYIHLLISFLIFFLPPLFFPVLFLALCVHVIMFKSMQKLLHAITPHEVPTADPPQ